MNTSIFHNLYCNYIDTDPLPATPAKCKYRATYTEDAQRVGQWSNVAEITVGGMTHD